MGASKNSSLVCKGENALVITRLKRYVYLAVAALALCAALLAAWPAVAQAQAERVVVRPGDTLWTISTERLGADATPQQIASEAERIYALNRDQIGPDPDLLFPGQELSVPAADMPPVPARGERAVARAAEVGQGGRAAAAEAAAPKAPEQPANLPKAPGAAPVPAVESSASSDVGSTSSSAVASSLKSVRSSVERALAATAQTFAEVRATVDGRQQLGMGIIALTLLIGGLMAWKLPMRRRVGESEAWGIYSGYYGGYAYAGGYYTYQDSYQEKTPDLHKATAAVAPEASEPELIVNGSENSPEAEAVNGLEAEALATEEGHSSRVGLRAIARARRERIRRGSARGLKRLPRRGLANGAYSPEVRSSLRERVPGTQPRTPKIDGRAALFLRRQIINGGR
jgi:LysM domain